MTFTATLAYFGWLFDVGRFLREPPRAFDARETTRLPINNTFRFSLLGPMGGH